MRNRANLMHCLVVALFLPGAGSQGWALAGELRPPSVTLQLLERRKAQQLAAAKETRVFHDFQFTNRVDASGIAFEHQIVDDAGKTYKAANYDHGNGMAVADVDGDGWLDLYFTTQLSSNRLYRNLGGGRFEDVSGTMNLRDSSWSGDATFTDFNEE